MSTLRSAIEELASDDVEGIDSEGLEADLEEIFRASDLLRAQAVRRIAEIERRGTFARDGHLSVTSWLVGRFRVAWSSASDDVRSARAMRSLPILRRAFACGEIPRAAVAQLVQAHAGHPAAFVASEALLVDAARSLPVTDLRRALDHWRATVDDRAPERAEAERFERRALHVSPTFEGMVRVDGDLDPENGQALIAAIRAVVDTDARVAAEHDRRTPAQRRADAIGEICHQWLDRSDRPTVAGERPHVVVTVDLDGLERRRGGAASFEGASAVSAESARRIACDASVSRVITVGPSQPLDVGRKTHVVSPAIRRALVVRDGGCAFPSCDRPPSWTDAHHVRHWVHGGPTALSNLVLLCRPHHRLIHHDSFSVSIEDGGPRFRLPDGSLLADRAPP